MSATAEREARIADAIRRRAGRRDRAPGAAVVDRIWLFFCSVRAALYEIVFLALLVLVGTLKGSVIPAQIPRYVPALEPLVKRWYTFDVFHSLIFSGTLALLAIAIVVCTINRVPGIWDAIAHPTVTTTRGFFGTADPAAVLRPAQDPAVVAAELTGLLRARRYRVLSERQDDAFHLYADRHRYGKLGTFPFHLALILVLVGGIVGATYGFREQVFTIPEGSIRDVGHGTALRVGLDRFTDTYNELGAPTDYRSDLVLYDGDRVVKRQSIAVNHPMIYRNVTFYQASFGPAASLRVSDAAGKVVFEDGVSFTYASRANLSAPAALVDLPAQGVRLELIFPNTKLDAAPEIGTIKLQPGELYAQARDWRTNQPIGEGRVLGQGESAALGGVTVQFVRERRFTVLQIGYNPGIPILFAAAVIGVLGLVVTFGFPHRRVRALVAEAADGAEVLLAPMARRDWGGKRDFVDTLAAIEPRLGAAAPYGRMLHGGD